MLGSVFGLLLKRKIAPFVEDIPHSVVGVIMVGMPRLNCLASLSPQG